MKKICLFIMILSMMMGNMYTVSALDLNPNTSDWFQWMLPDDEKAMGTALDASFMLDAPSGKHGFVRAEGEKMYFEDNTRARFWGTNIVASANFTSKDNIKKLADRVARSGFNLVRFHHMDANFFAPNIFGNNPTSTRQLDAGQLDKVFYFMSLLKERGVYYYVDLLVNRTPNNPGDGITDPSVITDGWKVLSTFDSHLIELQKEYANQLLTTVNPYTGVALVNDPSMVFIDVHNEDSLFSMGNGSLGSDFYRNELKALFNVWLKKKYPNSAAVSSAWAQTGKIGLESDESYENSTVRMPDNYRDLNYSDKRRQDCYEFLYDTETNMYIDFKAYLHNIGVKCLITGGSIGTYQEKPIVFHGMTKSSDFIDRHNYTSYPYDWYNNGGVYPNMHSSINIQSGRYLINFPAWQRIYGKPYILGEWQQCLPNEYRAEASLMMAAYSCFQDWNPIQFCMLEVQMPSYTTPMSNPFTTYNDPAYTSMGPASAIIFHRYDIKEAEDSYYTPLNKNDVMDLNYNTLSNTAAISPYGKVGTVFTDLIDNPNMHQQVVYNKLLTKANNNDAQSNQIAWDYKAGTFKLNTEYTNSISGYISGSTYGFTNSIITPETEFSTITLNSVTKNTLETTNRMLLTAVARSRNSGFKMQNASTIENVGSSPLLMEPVKGTIKIKTAPNDTLQVFALSSSGERIANVPVSKADGLSTFRIDSQYKTVHYEIVKNANNEITATLDNTNNVVTVTGIINDMKPGGKPISVVSYLLQEQDSITANNAEQTIYNIAQTETDGMGRFSVHFKMNENSAKGVYGVKASTPGSAKPFTTQFLYGVTDSNVNVTVNNVTKAVTVAGQTSSPNTEISLIAYNPTMNEAAQFAQTINALCAAEQGVSDANCNYTFHFALEKYAVSGTYYLKLTEKNGLISYANFNFDGLKRGELGVNAAKNVVTLFGDTINPNCSIEKLYGASYSQKSNCLEMGFASEQNQLNFKNNTSFGLTEANKNTAVLSFDILSNTGLNTGIFAEIAYGSGEGIRQKRGALSIDSYMTNTSDWQTVTIPFNDLLNDFSIVGDPTSRFNWTLTDTVKFSGSTPQTVQIRNVAVQLYDRLVCSVNTGVYTTEDSVISLDSVKEGEPFYTKAKYNNQFNKDYTAEFMVLCYVDGKLKDCKLSTVTLPKNSNGFITTPYTSPANSAGGEVKIILWRDRQNVEPIADSIKLPIR